MKRKLALLIASAMVLSSVPAVSFAATTNRISNVATGSEDTQLTSDNTPVLTMYERDLNDSDRTSGVAFQLDLANAEWLDGVFDGTYTDFVQGMTSVKVTKLSAKSIIIEGDVEDVYGATGGADDNAIKVKMYTELTDEGDATVTIDGMDSVISSGSYKFATVAEGSTTTTVEKKADISEAGGELKTIVIKETAPGAFENGELKLKLTSDWSFTDMTDIDVNVYSPDGVKAVVDRIDEEEAYITVSGVPAKGTTSAATISITAKVQYDDDEVEPGDICEVTVSGAGVDKTTLEVATAVTWGVTWEAEDKTVPTFYWGSADEDMDTLEVHFEETVEGSWLANRKTKIVFPEGVKVLGVDTDNVKHINNLKYDIDDNEVEISADSMNTSSSSSEADFTFQLSIEPGFTGDVTATLTGSGVGSDGSDGELSAVVATVAAPVTVTAESTDAVIDYRQTEIGDITITEAEAGILGKDDTLQLEIANLEFDDDPVVEVTSGDLKIDTVKTDGGVLKIKIKSESSKEPAVIKVTGVNLYMERNIPAGSYALKLSTSDPVNTDAVNGQQGDITGTPTTGFEIEDTSDAIFKNSVQDGDEYDSLPVFDTRKVTVVEDYVNVVTAGRDQGDNTFTTQIKVTIGATEMYANDQAIALDVPAYISNGYTMLPVRAVTEALSSVAVVRWDDPTHTVTISFGERVVKMTVGSNVMVVNGVEVPMQAQCEITGERAFIPLRDMGYALGLNDSKIVWDDATKTATLN